MADLPEARLVRDPGTRADAGSTPPARLIQLAPRHVPRALVWRLLFGTGPGVFAWLFIVIGFGFSAVFTSHVELHTPDYDSSATATITEVEKTSAEENDDPIYRIHFTFQTRDEQHHGGASYTIHPVISPGATVQVEYVAARPHQSRIVGMRAGVFSRYVLFVLLLPAIGMIIAIAQLRRGWRTLRLIRHGVETRGRLIDKLAIPDSDDGTEYRLTFEYDVDGEKHQHRVTLRDPAKLEDDPLEPMMYDPFDPRRATTLDDLPGNISIGANGEVVCEPGRAAWLLVMPIGAAVGLVIQLVCLW